MRALFSKSLIAYVLSIFIIIVASGLILNIVVDDVIVLISVLAIQFIILILILLHVFDKYIKPIQKASKTMNELVKGNYRARIHHPLNGSIGELCSKINILARNLSELSINEQMQAEQLSTVIDNTESGLVLIDEKGYIHLVNRKFLSIFGKHHRDYVGYIYYDVLDNEIIHEVVQRTFLYEEHVKDSFTKSNGNGNKHIEIVGAPIFNERNMLKGAVIMLYDITDLKNLEVMRKDFVANVSHELKTPITSIKGFAETLLDEENRQSATSEKFIKIINDESKRLQILIEDLLTLSKLEKDGFRLSLEKVDMTKLIDEVMPVMQQKANENNITLSVKAKEDIMFIADSVRLKQVIINLLANAINYTQDNGSVTVNIEQSEENVHIQVSDTGIGIPQEAIPRLFERFYRVDKARSRNTGGTGLGLAIVKHIVEVHDGKITVESKINKGTTFSVTLPKEPKVVK